MRPSKFSDRQIKQAIADVTAGTPLVAMCRQLGVTQTTFYRWRKKYGDGEGHGPGELRLLREENQKLKALVADLYVERQFLMESRRKASKTTRRARG